MPIAVSLIINTNSDAYVLEVYTEVVEKQQQLSSQYLKRYLVVQNLKIARMSMSSLATLFIYACYGLEPFLISFICK